MTTPVKVAAFVMALVIVFLGARAVGSFVGPDIVDKPAHTPHGGAGDHGAEPGTRHDDSREDQAP